MSVIEIKNLKKYFGKIKAVDDISFDVEKGEIFGFLGPNGAGKTTTIRCMMDFLRPNGGEIRILGKDARQGSVYLKSKIGYLSGTVELYDKWTGNAHVNFIKKLNRGKDRAEELFKIFNFDPSMKAKKLSSGNIQKLGLIMALVCEPEILILDEPTTGLDPILQNEVYKLLDELTKNGTTVFMSSHNLAEVEKVCTRVGVIKQGKMVAIESILSLKAKKIYTVTVNFAEQYSKDDFILDGIGIQNEFAGTLTLLVKGDIDPLIKKLSTYKIKDLELEHASLEDIFLEYYE